MISLTSLSSRMLVGFVIFSLLGLEVLVRIHADFQSFYLMLSLIKWNFHRSRIAPRDSCCLTWITLENFKSDLHMPNVETR